MAKLVEVQVIGTMKDSATRKAVRFFKERGVGIHLLDLAERALKERELRNIAQGLDLGDLIDRESREFKRLSLGYLDFDPFEELLEHPLIMRMPVVRLGKRVAIGEDEAKWKDFLPAS